MALGGGTWQTQNKVLPGTYINIISAAKASATLSDRGYAAVPLMLDWGPDNKIIEITNGDFQKNSLKLLGHAYADKEMLPLREIFQYAQVLYTYRLNGGGEKAQNAFCTAKYSGITGNRLSIVIAANADNPSAFDVSTYLDTTEVDTQTVTTAAELKANYFVSFKSDAALEATAKTPLTGGTNGTAENAAYQTFLDKLETYSFNTLGCPAKDSVTINLFVNYTKRMRDEVGSKFQTIIYNNSDTAKLADYEGVIELQNKIVDYDETIPGLGEHGLVYWVTGVSAGCPVNASNTNRRYNGELTVDTEYSQTALSKAIENGKFVLHSNNGVVSVLRDIDSLITVSDTKGDDFKSNQTIRVCDQFANDLAVLFNTRYLGVVPNDADGRVALWNDACKLLEELQKLRAIENFDSASVVMAQGDTKRAVVCTFDALNIVNAMETLYVSAVIV